MQDPIRITSADTHYLGKQLLVGITYLDHAGEAIRQEQFCGPIVEVNDGQIIIERTDTHDRVSLPPGLEPAPPGKYRLRSTGQVVVNPDFLARWEIKAPSPHDSDGDDDPCA